MDSNERPNKPGLEGQDYHGVLYVFDARGEEVGFFLVPNIRLAPLPYAIPVDQGDTSYQSN
jgi:hypothetical protein